MAPGQMVPEGMAPGPQGYPNQPQYDPQQQQMMADGNQVQPE